MPTLELRVRSLAPDGAREELAATIARLEELDADGAIAGYDVRVWGKKFCPTTASWTETGRSIHQRLVELDEWAARTGLSTAPFFDVRSGRSSVYGDARPTVVSPVSMLAEYVGTSLAHVTPCTDGRSTYSVDTHLDALESSGARVPDDPDSRPARVPAIMPAIRDVVRGDHRPGRLARPRHEDVVPR